MTSGVCLGIDVGKARIGVARCDFHRMLATPVETVRRDHDTHQHDIQRILSLVEEFEATEVIVGLPLNMRGERTASTEDAVGFAQLIATALRSAGSATTVRMVDERLSTVSAQAQLHTVGKNTKQSRTVIDQAAAVVILQHAIDSDKAQGQPVGSTVEVLE
ncbi:MAG: Holliday junction resolvase RuvX [Canibacter sp.]